jgi:hypothetical protein
MNVQRVVNYWEDKERYYHKRELGVTAQTVQVSTDDRRATATTRHWLLLPAYVS